MAFNTDKLSYFHSFSKMPVQSGTNFADGTKLGNAINKSGHTVTASEVWASDIPYYGAMGTLTDIIDKVQPYARKNDMCLETTTGKTYIYDGEGNWSLVNADDTTNAGKLVAGQLIKNANDEVVLLYHKGETLTNLTAANNANTNSDSNAARLWTTVGVDGKPCAKRLVEQFVGPTDKAINGLASVSFSPSLANGNLVSGTDYYDYCFSGTILWASKRTTSTVIDCFEYIGEKVSDVVDTVSTQGSTLQDVKDQVDTISEALGLGATPNQDTLGSRVTANENALKVLLGLAEGDKVAATESIATTAANAVSTSLTGTTAGTIGKAIADAKQEALDAINAIQHFSVVVVPEGQTMENVTPVENTIYLVKDANAAEGTYIEYIAFKQGETIVTEKIGSTAIDLSGYTTDAEHTALAERVTALDAATTGRVTVVEGKVSSLESQVSTLTTETIPAIQQSVTDGVSEAKTYAEGQASAAQTAATTAASQALATARGEITQEIEAAQTAAESAAADELAAAVEQIGKDIEAAKSEAISKAEVTITAGTGIVVTGEGKGTTFEIAVSDAVATASDLTALTGRVSTLETTTVPGIDTRLQAAEATITSLTEEGGAIDDIESKIEALAGETGRVTVVEGKVSDIETSLAEGGDTAKAIKAAQDTADAKVASVTVTDSTGTIATSGSTTAPVFTVTGGEISDTETKFVSGSVVKTYVDGQVSAAKSEIKETTDALADDIQSIKDVIGEGENGENIIDILSGIRTDLNATTATANTAAQSAEGDTYVSASQTGTKITVATNIAAITSYVDTELVKAGTAVATAISGVQTAVESKSLDSTSTGSTLVTVTTTGTVGTGMTTTVDTTALATALATAESNAISAAKAMALSATDTDDTGKVTVTLGGTVETPTITVTTSDIASAQTLSDLVNTVNTHISEAAGLYLSVEKVDVLPADENAKSNKIYLVPVDTEAGRAQNIHTEYIWTNNKWEIIGTTAIDINSLEAAASAAQTTADTALANAATAQAAADKAQGEVDALETVVSTLAQTHADDKAALEGSITGINDTIAAMDATETVNGLTVTQVDGVITEIKEELIAAYVPAGTTSVEGNVAYVGSTKHVIAPEKFDSTNQMPPTITSWVADLSNLTSGNYMFAGCESLTTFIGDLSSLTSGFDMFNGCTLDAESLEILSENLPTVSGGTIDIGASTNATEEVIATIKGKGWTLRSNGVEI